MSIKQKSSKKRKKIKNMAGFVIKKYRCVFAGKYPSHLYFCVKKGNMQNKNIKNIQKHIDKNIIKAYNQKRRQKFLTKSS